MSDDHRYDIKKLVDVMMDFFGVIASIQNDVGKLKVWILADKLFNEHKDKVLIMRIGR